jgi:hypothetical protein
MERSMESMKTYVIVWLCGLVTGLILLEHWQRRSGLQVAAVENAGVDVEPDAASTPMKVSAVIVTGAKADAERARDLLVRMMPWASTSATSLARLRSGGARAPEGATVEQQNDETPNASYQGEALTR